MEFIISFLNTLLPMLYVVTTFLYGFNFFRDEPFAEKSMGIILRITVFLHFIEVVLRWLCYDHFPLASIFEALSVLSLAAVLIYLYLEIRLKVQNTGFFILIFVLLMQLVSSAFISFTHDIPEILKPIICSAHIRSHFRLFRIYHLLFIRITLSTPVLSHKKQSIWSYL
jgi:ABC-type transport system involved in cytochrome c biogenesis permease subunit